MSQETEAAARSLRVRLQFVESCGRDDLDRAFADATKAKAGALVVLTTIMFFAEHKRLVDLAARNRLPVGVSLARARRLTAFGGLA